MLPVSMGGAMEDDEEVIDNGLMQRLLQRDYEFKLTSELICRGYKSDIFEALYSYSNCIAMTK